MKIQTWKDISSVLENLKNSAPSRKLSPKIAFITFNYGIDGVTIEISKYARCFEKIFGDECEIHLIGGQFFENANTVLKKRWKKVDIPNFDGWDKWDDGKWFDSLFYSDMPPNTETSNKLAVEIFSQASKFSDFLFNYFSENDISIVCVANVNSNPGNFAAALAVVLATERAGTFVIASNHDYFWQGDRTHFFKNKNNTDFFNLLEKIYPWNGKNWVQVNINKNQSDILIDKYKFPENKVFEVGTIIPNSFSMKNTDETFSDKRKKMSLILSNGADKISTVSIDNHLKNIDSWIADQIPIVIGSCKGLDVNILSEKVLFFLQPTRIIERKRIEKNWNLISDLLKFKPFLEKFNYDQEQAIFIHITGPTPAEHKEALMEILNSYKKTLDECPEQIAKKLFMSFSVGRDFHSSFQNHNLKKLHIWDIYQLSNIVLFPSEEEGRGLPLLESSAAGIPIITSQYSPKDVFFEVIGKDLSDSKKIKYTVFPEKAPGKSVLQEITNLVFKPDYYSQRKEHNIEAVYKRYGMDAMVEFFRKLLGK